MERCPLAGCLNLRHRLKHLQPTILWWDTYQFWLGPYSCSLHRRVICKIHSNLRVTYKVLYYRQSASRIYAYIGLLDLRNTRGAAYSQVNRWLLIICNHKADCNLNLFQDSWSSKLPELLQLWHFSTWNEKWVQSSKYFNGSSCMFTF